MIKSVMSCEVCGDRCASWTGEGGKGTGRAIFIFELVIDGWSRWSVVSSMLSLKLLLRRLIVDTIITRWTWKGSFWCNYDESHRACRVEPYLKKSNASWLWIRRHRYRYSMSFKHLTLMVWQLERYCVKSNLVKIRRWIRRWVWWSNRNRIDCG